MSALFKAVELTIHHTVGKQHLLKWRSSDIFVPLNKN
jgi:hypothetical protein